MCQFLKSERYSTDTAYDGEIGLEKAWKNKYDLILLDIMLPKKDGMMICKELQEKGIKTPIIMLTARASAEDKNLGIRLGAKDYLVKPVGISELFASIRNILKKKKE